jgi:arylsulfotransferase ASST
MGGLTRAELVRRGIGGGVGLALLGGFPARRLRLLDAAAAPAKRSPVHGFVTRPDLRPPKIYTETANGGTADGYLFLAPPGGPGARGGLIADNNGDPVYFHPTKPNTVMDFRPGQLRGKPVLSWWEGRYVFGVGKIGDYVIVDDSYRQVARFSSAGHRPDFHEVLLTDHNTLLVTVYETVSADLRPVGGPSNGLLYGGVIQELAVPSGRLLWQWRSLDHVDITETVTADQLGSPFDYFHINGIDVADDGHLIVSARNTSAIYKINRKTGKVVWRLGGKKSDFSMGKGTQFGFQHDARMLEGGKVLSLFDNGPRTGERKPESRAVVLSLDTRRMQATLKREIRHKQPPLFAFATGANQLLPNENRLVTWGITGWFTEYDADGRVCLDAHLSPKGQNYRVHRSRWSAKPTVRPAFKAYGQGGTARFYASWNGATALASWQLLTGPRPGALSESGTFPRRGFETSFAIPRGTRYASVVALDADGKALRRSKTVQLF